MRSTITQRGIALFIAFVLGISMTGIVFTPTKTAFAITENTEAELTVTQKKIEDSAKAYDEAAASLSSLEEEISENEAKIKDLTKSIPKQQKKSDEATVALYKLQDDGFNLLSMVLNAGSLTEFINSVEYITRVQDINKQEIARLDEMKRDLETSQNTLHDRKLQAEKEQANAQAALEEAQALREAAQERAEAEAAAELAAQQQAEAAAAAQQSAGSSDASANSTEGSASSGAGAAPAPTPTPTPAQAPINWSDDKATFVNEWGARIDAYLAGSATAGYGRVYAEAAWNYGVDPRYSPAISNTESTKGAYCFRPHNAWGWGSTSWGSWEEAIDAHVRGLSRGYSYTICIADAKKYCSNWEHWYNATLNQMNMI